MSAQTEMDLSPRANYSKTSNGSPSWNPYWVAFARSRWATPEELEPHLRIDGRPLLNAAFMPWIRARWAEWREVRGLPASPMCATAWLSEAQVADFGAWLEARP